MRANLDLSKRKGLHMNEMKSNIELHEIMRKKVTHTLRAFSLAYMRFLRTGKSYGHTGYATELGIVVGLYNEMFSRKGEAPVYSVETLLKNAMNECSETIDAENKQETFKFD